MVVLDDKVKQFLEQERERVSKLHATKHKPGFPTKKELAEWYINQMQKQNFKCFYCETSIFDIRKLIKDNKLLTRKTGYGIRGPILEVDKQGGNYSPANSVLACYYCNNDKSYITDKESYRNYFGENRKKYFEILMASIK